MLDRKPVTNMGQVQFIRFKQRLLASSLSMKCYKVIGYEHDLLFMLPLGGIIPTTYGRNRQRGQLIAHK